MSSRVRCPPWPGTTHSRSHRVGPHVTRKLRLLLIRMSGLVLIRLTNGRHSIHVHTSALLGASPCLYRRFWTEDPTRSSDSFLELMSPSILAQHHLRNANPGDKSRLWTPRRCTPGLSSLRGGRTVVGASLPVLRRRMACRGGETISLAKSPRVSTIAILLTHRTVVTSLKNATVIRNGASVVDTSRTSVSHLWNLTLMVET